MLLSRLGAFAGLPLLLTRAGDDPHRRQLWPRPGLSLVDDRTGLERWSPEPAPGLGRPDGATEPWELDLD